jgi:hypothetical protein
MSNETEASIISGVVRDPDGKPVAGARVYFTQSPVALPDIAALTNDKGEYSLTVPTDGKYKIGCTADEFEIATRAVEVEKGEHKKANFKLK